MMNALVKNLSQTLETFSGMKLKLRINDNRTTMLSVRWEPECARVSLHRIFLEAPEDVMLSLACYLKQERKILGPTLKAFIEDKIRNVDYSHLLDEKKLSVKGQCYDLQELYDEVNATYFEGKLDLKITWFGCRSSKRRKSIALGLYYDALRLVKVHRLLDQEKFPRYVVAYVIYHEMLHHVCPSYYDSRGSHRIHHDEFRWRESQFKEHDQAEHWLKEHRLDLFTKF
jgi:hypothetical protein